MCYKAADLAALGKVSILAFPTKNLLNENFTFLKGIINSPERIAYDTEICVLTLDEAIHLRILLGKFFKGNVIIITLHAYLHPKGDFKKHPDLLYFIYLFKENVCLFIDEAHLYLDSGDKCISLNNLYYETRGRNTILNSNVPFIKKGSVENILETLKVSPINLVLDATSYRGFEIKKSPVVSEVETDSLFHPGLFESLNSSGIQNLEHFEISYEENPQKFIQDIYPEIFDDFEIENCVNSNFEDNWELLKEGYKVPLNGNLNIIKGPLHQESNFGAFRISFDSNWDSHHTQKKAGLNVISNIFFLINTFFCYLKYSDRTFLMDSADKFFKYVKNKNPYTKSLEFFRLSNDLKNTGVAKFQDDLSVLKGANSENGTNFLTKKY